MWNKRNLIFYFRYDNYEKKLKFRHTLDITGKNFSMQVQWREKYARWTVKMSSQLVQLKHDSKNFNKGQNELHGQPRSGRPVTMNSVLLRKSVVGNSSTSTWKLSAELCAAQRTVIRHLKAIGKVNQHCREINNDLTENQSNWRIETCRKLLENHRDEHFILQVVTSDEK